MSTVCIDWDDTLVGYKKYEEIKTKLAEAGLRLSSKIKIHTEQGKPLAKVYIDDRGMHFPGDWTLVDIDELIASLK